MYILTGIIQNTLTDTIAVHCLGQCIPGSQIFPGSRKTHHFYLGFLFHYGIVEADLL